MRYLDYLIDQVIARAIEEISGSSLRFGGARAPRFKGFIQCGADRPDRYVVKVEAVRLADFQRLNEELPLGDLHNQRVALGGYGVGLLTHRSQPLLLQAECARLMTE